MEVGKAPHWSSYVTFECLGTEIKEGGAKMAA